MTLYLLDIASWQTEEKRPNDPLNLSVAKSKGFDLVNIKIGQGDWYGYRSWMDRYATRARSLGMGVSTFFWLDNSASGAAQARIAYERMKRVGGGSADGLAHQCDCEDTARPATFAIWRDYVNAMQDYLGRPIVNYTGDWWWTAKGWTGASLTPYVWAAPNVGYLGSYPGDSSKHWRAGWGGWGDYAVLQYAVSEIEGAGGGKISKSAIRDPKVWDALAGYAKTKPQEDDVELTDPIKVINDKTVQHTSSSGDVVSTLTFEQVTAQTNYYTIDARNRAVAVQGQLNELRDQVAELRSLVETAATTPQASVDPVAVAKALIAELRPNA